MPDKLRTHVTLEPVKALTLVSLMLVGTSTLSSNVVSFENCHMFYVYFYSFIV